MATIEITREQAAEKAIATLRHLADEIGDEKFGDYLMMAIRRAEIIAAGKQQRPRRFPTARSSHP